MVSHAFLVQLRCIYFDVHAAHWDTRASRCSREPFCSREDPEPEAQRLSARGEHGMYNQWVPLHDQTAFSSHLASPSYEQTPYLSVYPQYPTQEISAPQHPTYFPMEWPAFTGTSREYCSVPRFIGYLTQMQLIRVQQARGFPIRTDWYLRTSTSTSRLR